MELRQYNVKPEYARTYVTGRAVLVGTCPDCTQVLVVFNNHEVWPLVDCPCGWTGSTHEVENDRRYDNGPEAGRSKAR